MFVYRRAYDFETRVSVFNEWLSEKFLLVQIVSKSICEKIAVLDLMDIIVLKGKLSLIVFLTVSSIFSNEVIQNKSISILYTKMYLLLKSVYYLIRKCVYYFQNG